MSIGGWRDAYKHRTIEAHYRNHSTDRQRGHVPRAHEYEAGDDGFTKNTMSRIEDSSIMGALPFIGRLEPLGGGHHEE